MASELWKKWRARRRPRPTVRCILVRRLAVEVLEERSLLSVFVVTNVTDSGAGSLRQAILSSNATPGPNQIDFAIGLGGAQTISLLNALPQITNAVIIDGTTQTGYAGKPLIELDGFLAGAAANGLWVSAGNTTVRGLIVDRFTADGIKLDTAGNDTVQGNYIGTDPTGTVARGNGGFGVDLGNNFVNKIGGTANGQGNVISGNALGGVNVTGGSSLLMSENNNVVRLDSQTGAILATYPTGVATGSALIGADGSLYVGDYFGNQILHYDAFGNALPSFGVGPLSNPQDMIFGPDGNLYVGNVDSSVQEFSPSGTFLGTFVSAGSGGLSNAKGMAFGPDGNFYVAGYNNNGILRYDGKTGAFLGTFVTAGSGGLSGPEGIAFGPDGNLYVSSFGTKQVLRYRGTDGANLGVFVNGGGTLAQVYGLSFDETGNLQVVSELRGTINTYSGTTGALLHTLATGLASPQYLTTVYGNLIQGNYIGTDAMGRPGIHALPNQNYGIVLGASNVTVGGTAAGAGNKIAGNNGKGVVVLAGASGDAILGNSISGNAGVGIDLGNDGVTANTPSTSTGRPNFGMDYPVFTSASTNSTTLTVAGYVGSGPGQATFANARVEIFQAESDSTGYGQGEDYLGFLTTDASGNFSGTIALSQAIQTGIITGTATDFVNNTSEFGPDAGVASTLLPSSTTVTASANPSIYGQSVTFTATTSAVAPAVGVPLGTITFSDGGTVLGSSALVAGVATFTTSTLSAGTHNITASYGGSILFGASTSTTLSETVSQRAVSVASDPQAKTYGNADPALTYRVTAGSLVGTDSFGGSLSRAAGESVGSYAIGQGSLTLGANYALSFAGSSLAISQRAVSVAADAQAKVYGNADPALTYRITAGSVVGTDSFGGALTRAAGESVGSYAIGQGSLTLGANYAISFAGSSLAISQRAVSVAADPEAKVYGNPDPALAYRLTAGSLASGDAFRGTLSRVAGESVGSYAIGQGSLALGANYALSFAGSSLAISQRAVSVAADAQAKVLGQPDPPLTFHVTAGTVVGTDSFGGSLSRVAGESVGSYAIGQGSLTLGANYALSFAGSSLTISARPAPPPPPKPVIDTGTDAVPPPPSGPRTTPTVPAARTVPITAGTGPDNTLVRLSPAGIGAVIHLDQETRSDGRGATPLPGTLATATLPASGGPQSIPRGAVKASESAVAPTGPARGELVAPDSPPGPPPPVVAPNPANVAPVPGVVRPAPVPGPAPTGGAAPLVGLPWDRLQTKLPELEETVLSSRLLPGGVAGILMTVGYVLLNSRAGMWLLSFLTTTPLWKQFDPLEILQDWKDGKTRVKGPKPGGKDDDQETLQTIVG